MKDIIFDGDANFNDVIEKLSALAQSGNFYFRGYSNPIEMLPQLVRNRDYVAYEIKLLEEFENNASLYFNARTVIDFLACAQHYGIPTRLLDYTVNPFVALAFALYKDKNDCEDEYYYINVCNKNDSNTELIVPAPYRLIDFEKEPTLAERAREAMDYLPKYIRTEENGKIKKTNGLLFVKPIITNYRMQAQQGLFMLPIELDKDNLDERIRNNSYTIKIHKKNRDNLLSYLSVIGVDYYRLMPDLSSICDNVKRTVLGEM